MTKALDGLMGGHNNQAKFGINGGGGAFERRRDRGGTRNVWGGVVSSFRPAN